MRIRFSFRSDYYDLPEPIILFEFSRAVYKNFQLNPYSTFCELEKEIVPMGQLANGLYFSFRSDPIELAKKFSKYEKDDDIQLEMSWVLPGMVRIEITNRGVTV